MREPPDAGRTRPIACFGADNGSPDAFLTGEFAAMSIVVLSPAGEGHPNDGGGLRMSAIVSTLKHTKYVMGSLAAVLFTNCPS
jgi:hypothetical protein